MKLKISEAEIKKTIEDYLTVEGYQWMRNNSGAVTAESNGRKRFFRFGRKGSGDLFVWHKGMFYSIEVKSPTGKLTPAQEEWMQWLNEGGFTAFVARSVEDVQRYL